MNVIFWGTPEYAVRTLNALFNSKHNIIAVVTQPDKRRKRGQKLYPSEVKKRAIELNIPVFTPLNVKSDLDFQNKLNSLSADINIVVAYGQILPKEIINFPIYKSWNCHGSILPSWRGAAPIQRSIINGDIETGVGIMLMEEGLDTGPIGLESRIIINLMDNADIINQKLSELSGTLMIEMLSKLEKIKINKDDKLEDKISLNTQNEIKREISYAHRISKQENQINWDEDAFVIHKKVMGLYPNAFTFINGKRIKILSTEPLKKEFIQLINKNARKYISTGIADKVHIPGDIIIKDPDIGIIACTGSGNILIKKAKIEGRNQLEGINLINQNDVIKTKNFDR